jgi:hypothetical protein
MRLLSVAVLGFTIRKFYHKVGTSNHVIVKTGANW